MPDPRFFENLGPVSLAELAELTGAELADPQSGGRLVQGVAILAKATADTVTFLSDKRLAPLLAETSAGACFVTAKAADAVPAGCAALVTPLPQAAYAMAAQRLHRPRLLEPGPAISPEAVLEEGVRLAPNVVIGAGVRIGAGTTVGAGVVIGPGVAIGRDCAISANASIGFALIGDRVKILANAAIGEAGFGATPGPKGLIDIPQLGRVILQDGVTIGATSCVDRGAWEDTVVGENSKIDNIVHIAHNVQMGRNCAAAAYTGISGSVTIGDGVQFGGRAGVADHVNIGSGARVGASAGVLRDIPPGETWSGYPARPLREWLRETAWVTKMARRRREGSEE
ncbi:MAG: UDP-3-O-(3-hydroxymyristoyl)glucosamine N-acyltransferase [Phenylobacterium sp.]|uniref:UDP-3-O-(3-hydroxymyristoyl)glucosamine N-acyltransferase n=1 Tax=Phenylobacterium sp. TaxID=1871053 RepID=UPI00391B3A7D